jgi:hypothetical protein
MLCNSAIQRQKLMSGNSGKKINRKRFWYSIAPLLLLVVTIGTINLLTTDTPTLSPEAQGSTAVSAQTPLPTDTNTRPPILQATILPSPTPTATPRPPVPAEATITLFGPPTESSLPLNGRLTFYWTYSESLLPGQEMVLILRQTDQSLIMGSLKQTNVGNGFQVLVEVPEQLDEGTAVWQVQLNWEDTSDPLLSSESRSLTLFSQQ